MRIFDDRGNSAVAFDAKNDDIRHGSGHRAPPWRDRHPRQWQERNPLTISVLEASEYFRGLLLLIRKDLKTTQREIDLVTRVGRSFGFEEEFCTNAVSEILENPFIVEESPIFSSKDLAMKFLRDGVSVALADEESHPREEQWLGSVAERNGLDPEILAREREKARAGKGYPPRLEAEDLVVRYS